VNAGVTNVQSSSGFNSAATNCWSIQAVRVTIANSTMSFAATATTITAASLYVGEAPSQSL